LVELIKKSIRTKTEIVEQDFTEKNLRKILNYGHTLGHAIESFNLMNGKDILHGEAIAAGMICESYLSATLFNWRAGTLESLGAFLKGFCENVVIDPADHEQIIKICEKDKKKHNQTPLFSLLKLPGNPAINQAVSQDIILKSLEYYN
jgi:3-dehydroquinate synthase